jgi:hypothetical protein
VGQEPVQHLVQLLHGDEVNLHDEAVLPGGAVALDDLRNALGQLGDLRQLPGHGAHPDEGWRRPWRYFGKREPDVPRRVLRADWVSHSSVEIFPQILGLLMIVAGVTYWINSFRLFLALPIPYIQWVTLIAELSLALWLLVVGVNEAKWRGQAGAG